MNFMTCRLQAGLKQEVVAKALGIDQSTISKWETEKSQPRASLIPKIAELYGCKISALFESGRQ